MKRMFEFECDNGHRNEAYVDDSVKHIECPDCEELAFRAISAPRIKLEGISGSFPSAYDKWANQHEEATRVARKKAKDHGPTSLPGVKVTTE